MIFLVRHGKTRDNELDILQGKSDLLLSERGKEQILKMSSWFENFNIDIIYSSDSKRSIHTAQILNEFMNVDFVTSSALKERDMGIFDGMSTEELINNRISLGHTFLDETQDWEGVNGVESDQKIFERFTSFFEDKIIDNKNVIIVTHAGVIKSILHSLFNISIFRSNCFKAKTGSVLCLSSLDKASSYLLNFTVF